MKLKIGAAISNKLPKSIIDKQGKTTIAWCWSSTSELASEYETLEEFYEDVRNYAGKTPLLDIFDADAIKNENNLHLAKRFVQDALRKALSGGLVNTTESLSGLQLRNWIVTTSKLNQEVMSNNVRS